MSPGGAGSIGLQGTGVLEAGSRFWDALGVGDRAGCGESPLFFFFFAETGVTRLPESLSPTRPGRAGRLLLPWLPEGTVSVLRGLHPGNSAQPLAGTLEAFAFPFLFSLKLGPWGTWGESLF